MKRYRWQSLAREELRALEENGYSVWVEHPWHWVVQDFNGKIKVHVWPTSGKYMVYFDIGATLYRDAKELLAGMERSFKPARAPESTEDQIEAQKEVQKLRDNFLEGWGEDIDNHNGADIDMM